MCRYIRLNKEVYDPQKMGDFYKHHDFYEALFCKWHHFIRPQF